MPTFASKLSLLPWTVLTIVLALMFADIIADTSTHQHPACALLFESNQMTFPDLQPQNKAACFSLYISVASVLQQINVKKF